MFRFFCFLCSAINLVTAPAHMQSIGKQLTSNWYNLGIAEKHFSKLLLFAVAVLCLSSSLSIVAASSPLFAFGVKEKYLTTSKTFSQVQSPVQESEALWFLENDPAEEDDEDKKFIQDQCKQLFTTDYLRSEFYYEGYLKNRIQQLTFQGNKHPFISYFILYHSWKSHLA